MHISKIMITSQHPSRPWESEQNTETTDTKGGIMSYPLVPRKQEKKRKRVIIGNMSKRREWVYGDIWLLRNVGGKIVTCAERKRATCNLSTQVDQASCLSRLRGCVRIGGMPRYGVDTSRRPRLVLTEPMFGSSRRRWLMSTGSWPRSGRGV